jgi:hypothetical protein
MTIRPTQVPSSDHRAHLCALLRGDPAAPDAAADLLTLSVRHRVHVLLAEALQRSGPRSLEEHMPGLRRIVRQEAVKEWAQAADVRSLLTGLAAENVRPVLFKGAALAYTCYPQPFLRPHDDVDVLIRRDEVPIVRQALERAGYEPLNSTDGERVTHQFQYARRVSGMACVYDFHWRLANPELFANLLSFDDIANRAVPVPALGDHARAPCDMHALFIACIHRVAHHPHHNDGDDLIWLYDIHLLAARLGPDMWREFQELASRTRTRAICLKGLESAEEAFGTQVSPQTLQALATADTEPSTAFLGGSMRTIDVELSNLRTMSGWRSRLEFVWQHLFPNPRYMLASYGANPVWLPVLYVHRIIRGAIRWLVPSHGPRS